MAAMNIRTYWDSASVMFCKKTWMSARTSGISTGLDPPDLHHVLGEFQTNSISCLTGHSISTDNELTIYILTKICVLKHKLHHTLLEIYLDLGSCFPFMMNYCVTMQVWFKGLWIGRSRQGTGYISRVKANSSFMQWSRHPGLSSTDCWAKWITAATWLGVSLRTICHLERNSWPINRVYWSPLLKARC